MESEAETEWQLNCSELKQRGAMLLQSEEWSDCTLLLGQEAEAIRAHKLILAMASPVFESLFYVDSLDDTDTFRIPDVEPKIFMTLLNYIYTENINISSFQIASKLYSVANKYILPQLARVCSEYMCCNLNVEDACLAYQLGCKYQEHALKYESLQMIKLGIHDIVHHESIEQLHLSTLATLLREELCVEEPALFRAVLRCARAQRGRKRGCTDGDIPSEEKWRQSVRKALEQIRFLSMTLEEFAQGPAQSDLLTPRESLAVMVNIAGTEAPMPSGFCTIRQARYQSGSPSPAPPPPPQAASILVSLPAGLVCRRSACATTTLRRRRWQLRVLPAVLTATSYGSTQDYIAVFLSCEDPEPEPWACSVRGNIYLRARGPGTQPRVHAIEKTFSSTHREHGIIQFVERSIALDPNRGHVIDNALVFEARFTVEELNG